MLLRRKSGDLGRGGKKAQALREAELERQRQAGPPKLPEFANNTEQLSKFLPQELQPTAESAYSLTNSDHGPGGYYLNMPNQPRQHTAGSVPPVPPIPSNAFDPYARTESMTHRGRYSYASSTMSSINSPRRVRRRKDPTPFK